jgi:hypothetical protein
MQMMVANFTMGESPDLMDADCEFTSDLAAHYDRGVARQERGAYELARNGNRPPGRVRNS